MSKVFEWHQEQEELNGPTVDPDEDDMAIVEPTDEELAEIELELDNVLD